MATSKRPKRSYEAPKVERLYNYEEVALFLEELGDKLERDEKSEVKHIQRNRNMPVENERLALQLGIIGVSSIGRSAVLTVAARIRRDKALIIPGNENQGARKPRKL